MFHIISQVFLNQKCETVNPDTWIEFSTLSVPHAKDNIAEVSESGSVIRLQWSSSALSFLASKFAISSDLP
jgi:hypothetical protein